MIPSSSKIKATSLYFSPKIIYPERLYDVKIKKIRAIANLTLRMRSNLVVRASDCKCTRCNGPGSDPSIRRHSGIWGAADEAVLNIVCKSYTWAHLKTSCEYACFVQITRFHSFISSFQFTPKISNELRTGWLSSVVDIKLSNYF